MEELNKRSFDDRQYHFEAKFDLDEETPPPEVIPEAQNQIVVGILVGLIVILSVLFASMLLPCVLRCFRQRIPVSDKRIERRYETIEGWMISKVSGSQASRFRNDTHDALKRNNIRVRTRTYHAHLSHLFQNTESTSAL